MSSTDSPVDDADPSDDRLRLELYELLHDRDAQERKWQFWRLAAGHLVVGVILAYAFVSGTVQFLALTPILYGIVVMDALQTSVRRLYLQQRLAEIEAKLTEREPLFDWVARYGVLGDGNRIEVWDLDLNTVPETAQYVLVLTIYVVLVGASLVTWSPLDGASAPGGLGVTRGLLLLGYATFSVLVAVIVGVGYVHYSRVSERLDAVRESMPAE